MTFIAADLTNGLTSESREVSIFLNVSLSNDVILPRYSTHFDLKLTTGLLSISEVYILIVEILSSSPF